MTTQTLLSLIQNMAEEGGDFLSVATTTDINTNNAVISTTLKQYDDGRNGYFDGWWLYLNTTNNASVLRQTGLPGTTTYATTSGTVTVMGAALAAESGSQTFYLFRFNRNRYKEAIIEACRRTFPYLHVKLDDTTLATGNILPDGHFESWSSATALNFYTAGSGTFAQTSTAGLTRGGTYSAKYTAGAASDTFSISSDTYPRLLDLQGRTVDFYCAVYPEVANDAYLQITVVDTDGNTTNYTSTTTCVAAEYTIIGIEGQTLDNTLDSITIKFGITTDTKYVYFDDAYLGCGPRSEYLMPDNFELGVLETVTRQISSNTDTKPFYDLHPFSEKNGERIDFDVVDDGTNKYVKLNWEVPAKYRLRLRGYYPLETLSADTDTVTLEKYHVPLLLAKARMIFWERQSMGASSNDVARFELEYNKAERDYNEFYARYAMPLNPGKIKKANG